MRWPDGKSRKVPAPTKDVDLTHSPASTQVAHAPTVDDSPIIIAHDVSSARFVVPGVTMGRPAAEAAAGCPTHVDAVTLALPDVQKFICSEPGQGHVVA